MRDVLRAKLRCSQLFRDEPIKSLDKLLVEAILDDYWGSGLTMSITATTNPNNYPRYSDNCLVSCVESSKIMNFRMRKLTLNPRMLPLQAPILTLPRPISLPMRLPLTMTRLTKTMHRMFSYNLFHLRLTSPKLTLNRMNSPQMTLNNCLILHLLVTLRMI